uniref:Ribosomal protein S2 n=1 Tax=Lithodesmium undulatum TaxID=59812 RepID=A0A7T7A9U7_LITUN|nr:hypothetical protein KYV41_mgp25 [Lithodesmium undulatum]QQJ94646.1 hypothetical protein [Lithodesmium undulatum]
MKLKKIDKKTNYNLFKFNILKSKLYMQSSFYNDFNLKLDNIEINLRQILKLIYEYHINNKLIFFINLPNIKSFKLKKHVKRTKHKFILKSLLLKKINSTNFIQPDLLIFFNSNVNELPLNILLQLNRPIIIFNMLSNIEYFDQYNNHSQINLIKNKKLKQFIISLICFIIKKN